MALTPILLETYRRYKKETNTVVNWLAITAIKVGNVAHLLKPTVPQKPGGRLKGKARSTQSPPSQTIKVPVYLFEQLSQSIASAHVLVPLSILRLLGDVIRAREVCGRFYEMNSNGDVEAMEKNARHRHFIRVLQDVQAILQSITGPKSAAATRRNEYGSEDHIKERLSNIFEYLEVEDCLDLISPEDQETASASSQPVVYEVEAAEDPFLDEAFAIYCFLKDMADIRLFVHTTWREYREQKTSLTTAASTMNTAIEIFRRTDEAFLQDFPRFKDYGRIVEFLHHAKGKASTDEEGGSFPDHTGSYSMNDIRFSRQTLAYEHTYKQYFEFFLFRDNQTAFSTHDKPTKLTRDGEVQRIERLLSFFSESVLGNIPLFFTPEKDLLIQAIARSKANQKASAWMVFAIQTYIDLHRELGADVGRGYRELRHTAAWFTDVFTGYGESLRGEKAGEIDQSTIESCIQALKDFVDVGDSSSDTPDDKMHSSTFRGKRFFLANHPMLCGLMALEFLRKVHESGFDTAGLHGPHATILPFMHLYNAGLQSGFLRPRTRWADLEYLIVKHGEKHIFVGGRPNTKDAYARFCLAMGNSLQCVRSLSRARPGKAVSLGFAKPPRMLHYTSTYLSQIASWEEGKKVYQRANNDAVALLERLVADYLNRKIENTGPRASKMARRSTTNLSPLQTLAIFKDAMKEDEFDIRFDILTIGSLCTQLSRSIEAILQKHRGTDTWRQDLGGSRICFTLIPALAAPQHNHLPLLLKICHLLQETIDRVGNASYLCAEAQRGILDSARHPRLENLFLPADKIIGGPESPESPGQWTLTDDFNGSKYLPTNHNAAPIHHLAPYEERKNLCERLRAVESTEGDTASIIAFSSPFIPPKRVESAESEDPDEQSGSICAPGGISEEMQQLMLEAARRQFGQIDE
ncbi:hypothetical protein K491DRAFT_774652 [Lophiostoma macrostomum CBS 122681]|uniref:DUF6604 domain-containing protein n=1 Tax=Lophiostoma macrostomum CBS 122681 TaxID=1314788 RepID=A0A6A6TK81_9PLEO|nr:hypothetical protein K491DRAFT_774652 [Lophiostoma macrostomum CBS 122681]